MKPAFHVHICHFSALDDLPKREHGNPVAVLRLLDKVGRFSAFEMNGKLAHSVTHIIRKGWVKTDVSGGYPWTEVETTPTGRATLKEAKDA